MKPSRFPSALRIKHSAIPVRWHKTALKRTPKYKPHQGAREMARRRGDLR